MQRIKLTKKLIIDIIMIQITNIYIKIQVYIKLKHNKTTLNNLIKIHNYYERVQKPRRRRHSQLISNAVRSRRPAQKRTYAHCNPSSLPSNSCACVRTNYDMRDNLNWYARHQKCYIRRCVSSVLF